MLQVDQGRYGQEREISGVGVGIKGENVGSYRWNWDAFSGWYRNLFLWKIPVVYEGDPNEENTILTDILL